MNDPHLLALRQGLAQQQQGRLAEAERVFRQVLARAPGHAMAWPLLGLAQAQTSPPAATASPAAASAPAQKLSIRDIAERLEAAGYRDILEIDYEHGRYEAKALNAQGAPVKLYVNAQTGAVERTRTRKQHD